MLFIQCIVLCTIFTILILPPLFKNPISQIMSYPPEIRRRVESLPQYKDMLSITKRRNILRKVVGTGIAVIFLAGLTDLSGKTNFISTFLHVFILFSIVNLYDLVILDFIVFAHCKKVVIPGTEDMVAAYKNPMHHIKGACKGTAISVITAVLSGSVVEVINIFIR